MNLWARRDNGSYVLVIKNLEPSGPGDRPFGPGLTMADIPTMSDVLNVFLNVSEWF